jgi:mono/diheme cytochrome c family protein
MQANSIDAEDWMSDDEFAGAIEKGKGKMPAYGKSLKPDEIKAMVAYVRSLAK